MGGGGMEPPHELCYMWIDFTNCTCFSTLFMFHASAAFKGGGGILKIFGEGGRTFYGGLNNALETMIDLAGLLHVFIHISNSILGVNVSVA